MSLLVLALALALALAAPVGAQNTTLCATATPGSELSCYDQRATCHYDIRTGQCFDGAPATCYDYHRDAAGCVAPCAIEPNSGRCHAPPPACETLGDTDCAKRSDCQVLPSSGCQSGAAAGTCGSHLTPSACSSAKCYWDFAKAQCYFNLQEVNALYPCQYWIGWPSSDAVCGLHGCAATSGLCFSANLLETFVDDGYSASVQLRYSLLDVRVARDTLTLSAQVMFPNDYFYKPNDPVMHSLVLGPLSYPAAIQPGLCTSVLYQPSTIVKSTYVDQPALYAYYLQQVGTTRSLAFNGADPRDAAVAAIVGQWNTGGSSWVRAIDNSPFFNATFASVQLDLAWCVNMCGCEVSVHPSYTQYNVPLGVVGRSAGGVGAARQNVTVVINTYGSVQVLANSKNPLVATLPLVEDTPDSCPPGQQRRTFTLRLRVRNAFEADRVVGVFSLSDVSMVPSGFVQTVGAPTNCFDTRPVSVQGPTACPNGECDSFIRFEGRCTPIHADGDSLNKCSYQPPSARLQDLGDANGVYPTSLDGVHDTYVYVKSVLAALGAADPSPYPVGTDPTGAVPDRIAVNIDMPTYPVSQTNMTLTVRAGLLPYPDAPFEQMLELSSSANASYRVDQRNAQLYFDRVLTFAVYAPLPSQRETFLLGMMPDSIKFYGLSSTGLPMMAPPIDFATLQASLVRTPRRVECPNCLTPQAVRAGYTGIDAFSVPVLVLRALLPANGYRLELSWNYTLPTTGEAPDQVPTGRRLLQATSGGSTEAISSGTLAIDLMLDPEELSVFSADLGDQQVCVGNGFQMVLVASAGALLLGGAVKALFGSKF